MGCQSSPGRGTKRAIPHKLAFVSREKKNEREFVYWVLLRAPVSTATRPEQDKKLLQDSASSPTAVVVCTLACANPGPLNAEKRLVTQPARPNAQERGTPNKQTRQAARTTTPSTAQSKRIRQETTMQNETPSPSETPRGPTLHQLICQDLQDDRKGHELAQQGAAVVAFSG